MGAKLLEFYEKAKEKGRLKAQMRLAVITGIPSNKAGEIPDSPDMVKKFEDALREIEKEFN